jgi:hypothetical protein
MRAGAIAGAIAIIATSTAVAIAQTPAPSLSLEVAKAHVGFGAPFRVSGTAGRDLAGRTVALEFAPDGRTWSGVATTTVGQDGRYRFAQKLPRSGALRVALQADPAAATAASEPPRSQAKSVRVSPRVGVSTRRLNVKAGRVALVAGRIAPASGGVRVALQVRRGGRWVTIDRARTRAGGGFTLHDRQPRTQSAAARVTVVAHAGLAGARRPVGQLNVFRVANASWYGPGFFGRKTGCGGRLGYSQLGVAHKTLPCGTKVTFRYNGRTLTVPVIDRGPYAGSREYDLTASTAQRLGFHGHGAILSTR